MTVRAAFESRETGVPDAETQHAVRAFMARVEGRYSAIRALLYGSRARGTHGPESDADLAVVLRGERGDRTSAALDMAGMAFEVLLETGILIEALPLWEGEIEKPEAFTNPVLIDNIRREGLPV